MVYGEFDDAPGLILIGIAMIALSVWIGFRSKRPPTVSRRTLEMMDNSMAHMANGEVGPALNPDDPEPADA